MTRARVVAIAFLAACGRLDFTPFALDGNDAGDATNGAETCAAHPAALFCDGFEADSSAWDSTSGAVSFVTSPVHGGQKALRAAIQTQAESASVSRALSGLSTLPQYYLRAWYFADGSGTYGQTNLLNVDKANGEGVTAYSTMDQLAVYYETGSTGTRSSGVALPLDQWHCLELSVLVRTIGGVVYLWLDDQLIVQASDINTAGTLPFSSLDVGIPFSGALQTGPATIYIDDVVVDSARIGCGP